jgi:hypothetical protein
MRVIYIKNLTDSAKDWGTGRTFDANEEYQVPENKVSLYAENSTFLAILNIEARVGNSNEYFGDLNEQINWLKGDIVQEVEVAGTVSVVNSDPNDRILRPYPPDHKHIDSSEHIFEITLSNKNGNTYSYSCSAMPEYYDCIFANHSEI